ncbi:hypothetical protein [Streptomyces spirodelae]|uniref:Uncharacterized protein n=1 Tax=Streptomyces spirodelae TaxID=2812904 RepID=A0ABS3WQB6_9ACTN|nr:hypothetical protein [Streptomyces spirodelae]MBO8185314.1 hypothetical protein [Streptomyces spirodelae]
MNEVLPQLDELLFPSIDGVTVQSVEVTDRSRPDRGLCDFQPGGLPGIRMLVTSNTRLLPAPLRSAYEFRR